MLETDKVLLVDEVNPGAVRVWRRTQIVSVLRSFAEICGYYWRNYPTYQLNFLALEQTTVAEELNDCLYGIKFEVETEKQNSEQKLEKLIQNKLEDLHVGEDKGSCLNRANRELRAPRGESEYNSEEVKQWRTDLGRGERKLEGDLKMIIDSVNEMGKLEVEQEAIIKKKELEISSETTKLKESKKKLTPRLQEAEEAAKAAQAKCSSLKKAKQQLLIEEMGKNTDSKDDELDVCCPLHGIWSECVMGMKRKDAHEEMLRAGSGVDPERGLRTRADFGRNQMVD
ncbi:uncharacterized protein [Mobula birostris]|uniref:uncharacterized protein n=1 Tax=Mobula birostris TaxID=1983395 RepID=UPI003B28A1B7